MLKFKKLFLLKEKSVLFAIKKTMSEVKMNETYIPIPGDEATRENVEVVRNYLKDFLGTRKISNSTLVRYAFNRVAHAILTQSRNKPETTQEIQDGEED